MSDSVFNNVEDEKEGYDSALVRLTNFLTQNCKFFISNLFPVYAQHYVFNGKQI